MAAFDLVGALYSPPKLGDSSVTVLDATDKTVALRSGAMVTIVASAGDVLFAMDGLATTPANAQLLLSGNAASFLVPLAGPAHVLHLTQGPTAGGSAYVSQAI